MTKKQKKKTSRISKILLLLFGCALIVSLLGMVIARSFFPSIYYDVKDVVVRLVPFGFQTVSVGQSAPDFTTKNLEGETVTLSQFRGQTVLLTLTKTWCPDCTKQIPFLNQTYETHGELVVLDVDIKEPEALIRDYAKQMQISYPVLFDLNGEIKGLYQVSGYPTTFVIDPQGIIRFKLMGEIAEDSLTRALKIVGENN